MCGCRWRAVIFIYTLYIYTTFHASRKPISVVKSVLHPNCSDIARRENKTITPENATFCMWKPFDTDDYNVIFGYLDLSYLLSYALGMFFLGQVAERVNLRLFLTWGCILSGITTATFGVAYFADIHALWFFFLSQVKYFIRLRACLGCVHLFVFYNFSDNLRILPIIWMAGCSYHHGELVRKTQASFII